MKKTNFKITITLLFLLSSIMSLVAQNVSFPDDNLSRGYYDRPYKRYEAETNKCTTNGAILEASFNQTLLQSEASNQVATQLSANGSYVQWTNKEAADGMVIRFSIPDGTTGTLKLYVGNTHIQDITLESKWAWQYFPSTNENDGRYAYNSPSTTRFPRMRFDEVRVKLTNKIPENTTFKLVKENLESTYTIDFVELELIPAKITAPAGAAVYSISDGRLDDYINAREGQTIYIPEGVYDFDYKLRIWQSNVKIIGAGMWYTQLHFTADPGGNSYSQRGIEAWGSNITLDGLYLTTVNDRRYKNYGNSGEQVGKGLMNSFGSGSTIRNIWVEHFECGAWFDGSNNLTVSHCRFRNNYADGVNLSYGSKNCVVSHCSFRNNGDDDMASWSRDYKECSNNTFQYNTAENNWRAASIALFGGKQQKVYNCVVIDPMEAGIRINSDFNGSPFSNDGYYELKNISVYKGGVKSGTPGTSGDLWGARNGALYICSDRTWGTTYDVKNVKLSYIDLYDSKGDAVHFKSGTRNINNVSLESITINTISTSNTGNGTYYGIYFNNASGSGNTYCVFYNNVSSGSEQNTTPGGWTKLTNCTPLQTVSVTDVSISPKNKTIAVGETFLVTPTFTPSNATNRNITYDVVDGSAYASVTNAGVVTGLAVGEATVRVTTVDGNKTDECIITIVEAPSVDIQTPAANEKSIIAYNNTIQVNGLDINEVVSVYNLLGSKIYSTKATQKDLLITLINEGFYVVVIEGTDVARKVTITK